MHFDKVQFVLQKPAKVAPTAPIRRFEPVTIDMASVGPLENTGYSLYNGTFAYREMVGDYGSLDLVASGPKGTAENKFIMMLPFKGC